MPDPDFAADLAELRASLPMEPEEAEASVRASKRKHDHKRYAVKKQQRLDNVAILDMETDPFDPITKELVFPFLAVLYSDNFDPIVIWEEDPELFVTKVIAAIEALPDSYTIYAHNGGKFDFYFLLKRLRGQISFKGRGIMKAQIGNHELRDSFHIIPEKLAHFEKGKIDYDKMRKGVRSAYKEKIIDYCIQDCRTTLRVVKEFLSRFGFKISIGAAALAALQEHYRIDRIQPYMDARLRKYFHGGRVECIQGAGIFIGNFRLHDVNSMYPDVMANVRHPIGAEYEWRSGKVTKDTFFVHLRCRNNGALMTWVEEKKELTCNVEYGEFFTTIHEYLMALDLGLISDVEIITCVDCYKSTKFPKFVLPLYESRIGTKKQLKDLRARMQEGTMTFMQVQTDDTFFKLILNNAYGKTAQNPRRFKEHCVTEVGEKPDDMPETWGLLPKLETPDYWLWERPSPGKKFFNVGTGASITGAARAKLMHAKHHAINPIYCDTDSLICEELRNCEIHNEKLGAWKIEAELKRVVIAGKKLYGYETQEGKIKVKSKGTQNITMEELEAMVLQDAQFLKTASGPTLHKNGEQSYMVRTVRATARRAIAA